MAFNRWSLGVLVSIVALLMFVGFSSAQKTPTTETMVWDTTTLASSNDSFDEERLRFLSEGWEPFSTSAYQVGNNDRGFIGHYYLHLRKRVPLALVAKHLTEVRSAREANAEAARKPKVFAKSTSTLLTGTEAVAASKPFLGLWVDEGSFITLTLEGSGSEITSSINGIKGETSSVYRDKDGEVVLASSGRAMFVARLIGSKLIATSENGELTLSRKS